MVLSCVFIIPLLLFAGCHVLQHTCAHLNSVLRIEADSSSPLSPLHSIIRLSRFFGLVLFVCYSAHRSFSEDFKKYFIQHF